MSHPVIHMALERPEKKINTDICRTTRVILYGQKSIISIHSSTILYEFYVFSYIFVANKQYFHFLPATKTQM